MNTELKTKELIEKLIKETITNIEIIEVFMKLDYCNDSNYVIYWKEFMLTVKVENDLCVVVNNDITAPQLHKKGFALTLSRLVKNGKGERPEVISIKKYYEAALNFLRQNLEEHKKLYKLG